MAQRAAFVMTGMRPRCSPLHRFGDPLPATRLVVHRPHQEGSRRVGQFGDAEQLAVKFVRSALVMMRHQADPVPDLVP